MRIATLILAGLIAVSACRLTVAEVFKDPPAGSYAAATRQLKIGETATPLHAAAVTSDFFPAVGAPALVGRLFVDADYAATAVPVAVLSHRPLDRAFRRLAGRHRAHDRPRRPPNNGRRRCAPRVPLSGAHRSVDAETLIAGTC